MLEKGVDYIEVTAKNGKVYKALTVAGFNALRERAGLTPLRPNLGESPEDFCNRMTAERHRFFNEYGPFEEA